MREGGQVQDLRCKAYGRIFSDRRVKAAGAVEIPRVQGVDPAETLDTLFELNQQWFTREEVLSPSPGVTKKGFNRKTLRQRMSGKKN